jgi:hypothetical protein
MRREANRIHLKNKKMVNWKEMGFESEEHYQNFLRKKMEDLINRIKTTPELLDVFKRMKNK